MCIICPAGTKICLCLLVFYAAQRIKSAPGCKRQKYDWKTSQLCSQQSLYPPPPPSSFSLTVVPSHLQLKLWLLAGGLDGGMQKHSWECGQDLQRVCVRARACACDPLVFASLSGGGNFNSACVLAAQWNIWDCSLRRAGATQRHSFFSNPEARKHIPTRTLESGPGHRSFSSSISLFHPRPPSLSFGLSTCQPVSPGALSQFLKL